MRSFFEAARFFRARAYEKTGQSVQSRNRMPLMSGWYDSRQVAYAQPQRTPSDHLGQTCAVTIAQTRPQKNPIFRLRAWRYFGPFQVRNNRSSAKLEYPFGAKNLSNSQKGFSYSVNDRGLPAGSISRRRALLPSPECLPACAGSLYLYRLCSESFPRSYRWRSARLPGLP